MTKEDLQAIKKYLNCEVTTEGLIKIINELMEDNMVQMDTIAQMQCEIDRLEFELECYQAEKCLGC